MMSRQRNAELALDSVIGATQRQQVQIPVLEAAIITVTASFLGLLMAMAGTALLAYGLNVLDLPGTFSMPWGLLGWCVVLAFVVAALATVLPTLRSLREPAPKVIARLIAS